jgi:predicted ester cyclase
MAEEPVALVKRWFEEVWNQKRSASIRELVAADCVAHETSEKGGDLHGPEGLLELHARILDHFTVHDCFGAGDRVAVRWSATMHHRGNGLGMEATGAEVTITGMGIARLENGKVKEHWDICDKLGMFQQIEAGKTKRATA